MGEYSILYRFPKIGLFTDVDISGTQFNRPGFMKMMAEVETVNVSCICVKDMSRLRRNYLQVGYYTEMMFPDKGILFIIVNNNIDTVVPAENEFNPFLNIMNKCHA